MRNVCKGCLVGLAGMLLFSSVASSQTREPNKPKNYTFRGGHSRE